MTTSPDPRENPEFDRWCFTAQSDVIMDGHPLPLLTVLVYRVCGENPEKFEEACNMLRAAFEAGHASATERAARLHENVNPASDQERFDKVPGTGAMGAVIEYRDLIRKGDS